MEICEFEVLTFVTNPRTGHEPTKLRNYEIESDKNFADRPNYCHVGFYIELIFLYRTRRMLRRIHKMINHTFWTDRSKKCGLVYGLFLVICFGIISRLLPHPPNFTAIGAVALFAGVYLPRRWGILVPVAVMFITDFFFGFYEFAVMFSVYGSFLLVGFVGFLIRRDKKPSTVFLGALSVSIIFFAVTNFAVWAATPLYPKTGAGLYTAYALAVPFFRNMLLGDLFYTATLFMLYELVVNRILIKVQTIGFARD